MKSEGLKSSEYRFNIGIVIVYVIFGAYAMHYHGQGSLPNLTVFLAPVIGLAGWYTRERRVKKLGDKNAKLLMEQDIETLKSVS